MKHTIASNIFQPQTLLIPETTVPEGVRSILVSIDRTNWLDPNTRIEWSMEGSVDDGFTWRSAGGGMAFGGECKPDGLGGAVSTVTDFVIEFSPVKAEHKWKLRGKIKILGGAIKTAITINADNTMRSLSGN